jgi:anti-sigma factor ChrR (cupin superfamily)
VLGDKNNDTVVSAYNLAELYTAMGEVEQATALQEALVKNLEDRQSSQQTQQEKDLASSAGATATSQTAVAHSSGDNVLRIHKQINNLRGAEAPAPVVTPPAPSQMAGPEVTDGAEIVRQQMQRDQAEAREAAERAKAKVPPVTSATRPTKPATRRKPQQPV